MMLGRFELPTFCLEGRYSIQLSYSTQLYRRWDLNSHVFFKTTDFKSVAYYQFRHFGLFYLDILYHKRKSLSSCGLYSFFTSRSSSNDKFHRNYQTHFQPFLDDFHVGKTTHQACFVFGKKRLELLILSALDFESSVYANSTTYRS